MVGSYAAQAEPYVKSFPEEDVPSGMMARGDYKVRTRVIGASVDRYCAADADKTTMVRLRTAIAMLTPTRQHLPVHGLAHDHRQGLVRHRSPSAASSRSHSLFFRRSYLALN